MAGLPSDPFLRALAEHWEEILARADLATRRRLGTILDQAAAGADPLEVRTDLEDEMFALLPTDHPVVAIMREKTMFDDGTAGGLATLGLSVGDLIASVGHLRSGPDSPPVAEDEDDEDAPFFWPDDEVDAEIQERLLSHPMLSPDQVTGPVPADAELISLSVDRQSAWLPGFQFDEAGRPRPLVLEINKVLHAAEDPWGVMSWWVDPHSRLEAVPRDLIGDDEALLRRAAQSLVED